MPRTRTANTTTASKPSLMSRLQGRRKGRTVTTSTKHSTNPITGSHTTTTTKKEVDNANHRGHHTGTTGTTGTSSRHTTGHTTGTTGRTRAQRRKPSMGDKVSGAMMKLRGSLTRRPGLKAAGTRRMHGTDGKGEHYTRAY